MKKTSKIILAICITLCLCIGLGIFMKITNNKKIAENTYIDYAVIDDFPAGESIEEVCQWLNYQGYEYRLNGDYYPIDNGETLNGWSFYVSTSSRNGYDYGSVFYASWSKHNIDIVAQNCKEQLRQYFGEPARIGGESEWYTDGRVVLSIFYYDQSVSITIGSYDFMSMYL